MSKYYRIRATSLAVYYSYINSDDFPHIFDKDGNPKEYDIHAPEFDLFDQTWDYGVEPIDEDWEFTDYEELTKIEYTNLINAREESRWSKVNKSLASFKLKLYAEGGK